jgi:hypothetical protein
MYDLQSEYRRTGGYWFESDTMRFFKSRVADVAYLNTDGSMAYFTSSEKGPDNVRKYSVRVFNRATADIDTYPDYKAFQAYASRSGADRAARKAAGLPVK